MQNVFDRRDAADGFLGENAEFQRQRSSQFSIQIDRAAAHAGDDAGVLDFFAFELHQNNGLLRAQKIRHDADDFEVELFDLIAGENCEGVALHAWADLAERQNVGGLC
jgi:hypothetical protein